MGYHELPLPSPKPTLRIDTAVLPGEFDVDYAGMDDGLDRRPEATFRFLFQLGSGYMIYLYVIAADRPGSSQYFHTFWVKDCAVAEVEMEELGAPSKVEGELDMPLLYERLVIEREAEGERAFSVTAAHFSASHAGEQRLSVTLSLLDAEGGAAELRWQAGEGWGLAQRGQSRGLDLRDRLRFEGKRGAS